MKKTNIKEDQKDKDANNEMISYQEYLSSIQLEEIESKIKDEKDVEHRGLLQKVYFILDIIVSYISFVLFTAVVIPALSTVFLIGYVISQNFQSALMLFGFLICSVSTFYCMLVTFYIQSDNHFIRSLFQDGIFFVLSTILVFSYLRTLITDNRTLKVIFTSVSSDFEYLIFTFFSSNLESEQKRNYRYDYPTSYRRQDMKFNPQFERGKGNEQHLEHSARFSLLKLVVGTSNRDQVAEKYLNSQFDDLINPNYFHFFILISVILLKLIFVFYYIHIQSTALSTRNLIDMGIIIFTYVYTAWNLNRILGNYDLIRKKNLFNSLNNLISYSDISQANYKEKIDITSPISLESWDNMRKCILNHEREFIKDLEVSYFCLVFYYLFVILVCASAYFELYWIFNKGSIFLDPISVIMSTFNFIFLSFFFLFRFKEGTQYNDCFGELQYSIVQLQDTVSDLLSMFDELFKQKEVKEQRYSSYGIIIKRLKLLSKDYIDNRISYQGRIYNKTEKNILRRKMLKSMQQTFQKLYQSIQMDYSEYKYQFGNVVEINFKDFAFTVIFFIVTSLPTIVPKFMEFFQAHKNGQ